MSNNISKLTDDDLEQVGGGLMSWNGYTNTMTYTHEETGAVTTYQVLDMQNAWTESNRLHGERMHEDDILAYLLSKGYIA